MAKPPPTNGRVLGASISPTDPVSHAELATALEQLKIVLRTQLATPNASAPPFSGPAASSAVNFQSFATSQRIDQLANVTITNGVVHGVSGLIDADIPDGITASGYLALTGGTVSGNLNVSGSFTGGSVSFSGASTTNASSTNLYALTLTLGSALSLANGGTGAMTASGARTNLGVAYATSTATDPSYNIAAWGDSTTGGGGGATPYTTYLSQYLGGRPVYQGGVGGQTSTQIESRMVAATNKLNWTAIIFAGTNNANSPSQVEADIAAMVAALGSNTHYIILSILTAGSEPSGSAGYINKAQINTYLSTTYPGHYYDVRAYLVSQYNSGIPQDVIDHAADTVPSSLRADDIHPNSAGNQLIAQQVASLIQSLDAAVPPSVLTPTSLPSIFASPFAIGTNYQVPGFFSSIAIGTTSTTTPSNPLDVSGSINISTAGASYKIEGQGVIWASSTLTSLFLGTTPNANPSGNLNTSVGWNALLTVTTGSSNSAFGKQAMGADTTGGDNVGVGAYALGTQTSGARNTTVGSSAMFGNTVGNNNVAVGYLALSTATSSDGNTALGYQALKVTANPSAANTAGNNTAAGYLALTANTYGTSNTGIGSLALLANTTGLENTAVGSQVLGSNTSGNRNVGIGTTYTLSANTSGSYNLGIGSAALRQNTTGQFNIAIGVSDNSINGTLDSNTVGNDNVAIGHQALKKNTTGISNVAMGSRAATNNISATTTVAVGYRAAFGGTGNGTSYYNQGGTYLGYQSGALAQTASDYNTLIGYQAGYSITTGAYNIALGQNVDVPSPTASQQLNIGNLLYGTGIYNGGSQSSVAVAGKVGIATTTPWRSLAVTGTVGFDGLSGAVGAGSLCLSANKEVVYNSGTDNCLSSLRSTKHDIADLTISGTTMVAALQSVSFIYNDDASSTVRYGFIAEDTAAVDPHFATYDAQGRVSGVDDRSLISILVKAVQELMGEVASIEARLNGIAQSLSSRRITATEELCVADNSGTTCVSRGQLQALLGNQSPAQSSDPTPPTMSGTTTPDTEAPVITILGNNPAAVDVGATYNDLGATVTDNKGHELSYRAFVNGVLSGDIQIDTSHEATDTIDYVATDTWGNTATGTRTVMVQPPTSSPLQ